MDFNFLPKLPKSNLDDRKYQDLVDECILRIPRYCPEWTNYNPSDPGITLVELFAWLTDQMLARFNQVPRRNYITFLELLGIRLQPPTPARTNITFYLSTVFSEPYTIPAGIEVATIRTETESAIVFSTERPLVIGNPSIRHFLTAERTEEQPSILRDRFVGSWALNPNREWEGREISLFNEQPQPGNCFYVVFDGEQPIEGNAIVINLKGEAATSTGINPEHPPRHWEAWNGNTWESILLKETDDGTQGFSFAKLTREGGDPVSTGADILLHLPLSWPVAQFITYQGRWLRCVCINVLTNRPNYIYSPRIVAMSTFAIGGSIEVVQCTLIRNEIVGESDGNPGQTFQLQSAPILPRKEEEYLTVTPPGGLPQVWREVDNFASSTGEDLHYASDSLTGTIQFGPLIREPAQIREQTYFRTQIQATPRGALAFPDATGREARSAMERQYGAVPPRGSTIQMVAYRTGGGHKGNVQAGTIQIVKSAVPYVTKAINHQAAQNGADAESLENAVMRVPRMLRTRNRAVTAEDFENLALEAGGGAIARTLCLSPRRKEEAGRVRLLLVPQANTDEIDRGIGIDPDRLSLNPQLTAQVLEYLDERRLLGVEVLCDRPEYVGVNVQTKVALDTQYNNPTAEQEILSQLQVALYRFLNPLTGGPDGTGWPFGRPVYPSDIIKLLQTFPAVRYLDTVQLFELRKVNSNWVRFLPQSPVIDPGPLGLICSWRDTQLRSGHIISLI